MLPVVTLLRAMPQLWSATRHLSWPLRLRFWAMSLAHYRNEYSAHHRWQQRQRLGNPALRAQCCGRRPQQYAEQQEVKDIADLVALVKPAGAGWGGYINFFDCMVCGQAWVEDWKPNSHGGTRFVRKA
jgi:hypothetical protein